MCITHTHTLHCGRVFNCISSSSIICVWRTADGSCNYHTSETNNGSRNTAGAGREQQGNRASTGAAAGDGAERKKNEANTKTDARGDECIR